jgi:PAS domain S-box-containing protein
MNALSSKLLREIFDAVDGGLIVVDHDARVEAWNDWIAAASGIPAERAMSKTLAELFPDARLTRLSASLRQALELGASSLLTHSLQPALLPLRTRAGQELIHNVSLRPIGDGRKRCCLIQVSDVTIMTQREQVLRARQNARYDAVVESALDAILTLDADGLIQQANPAAAREFGYAAQDIVGRPIDLLFHGDAGWASAWEGLVAGEGLERAIELTARRKDGSESYLEVSASRWMSHSHVFITAILRDVNERHAAELALRLLNESLEQRVADGIAERRLLAEIVETTDAFIMVLDLEFNILAVNRANTEEFERIYGVRPKEGDNALALLKDQPEEQAKFKAFWGRALTGETMTFVEDFGDPNLDRPYYEIKFNVLRDREGRQIGAYNFVYDVTERLRRQRQLEQTEEALRQSQKMEAVGNLTGGIAHDFNNMLTGIIGAMDILKRRIATGRYEDTQRFMDAAIASANRAAALTHRLLAFARRQPLDPKSVDTNGLIWGMEELLRRTLGEQVQMTVDLADDLWPVLTDANQLENAILNLAINARDAMPNGGQLTISTDNKTLADPIIDGQEPMEAGDYVVIAVADTGTGMSPELMAKVFEPFFTTKPIGEGTGLGLSMIYGFAKQSMGQVRIDSVVDAGTTVRLYLPRHVGLIETQPNQKRGALPKGEGETVLLVEDDSSVRLLIGEVLGELGYACIEAKDGQAALPILNSNTRLDLMISDIGLPGLNGRQLADIARKSRPDLKILFVTGYAEHALGHEKFLGPGMQMATKPFTLDALALKIREIIAN